MTEPAQRQNQHLNPPTLRIHVQVKSLSVKASVLKLEMITPPDAQISTQKQKNKKQHIHQICHHMFLLSSLLPFLLPIRLACAG
jgi:hypothetical protein